VVLGSWLRHDPARLLVWWRLEFRGACCRRVGCGLVAWRLVVLMRRCGGALGPRLAALDSGLSAARRDRDAVRGRLGDRARRHRGAPAPPPSRSAARRPSCAL